MIKFDVTQEESKLIGAILDRVAGLAALAKTPFNRLSHEMDLCACHANGTPLDFKRMLETDDDFSLTHDVYGIARHIDRNDASPTAGQLRGNFLPRFTKREAPTRRYAITDKADFPALRERLQDFARNNLDAAGAAASYVSLLRDDELLTLVSLFIAPDED